jgi:hypothetical protein
VNKAREEHALEKEELEKVVARLEWRVEQADHAPHYHSSPRFSPRLVGRTTGRYSSSGHASHVSFDNASFEEFRRYEAFLAWRSSEFGEGCEWAVSLYLL